MSNLASSKAWKCKTKTAAEKLILLSLADHHEMSQNLCIASIPSLASDAQLCERMIYKGISSLEKQGLIQRINRHMSDRRKASNEYILLFL